MYTEVSSTVHRGISISGGLNRVVHCIQRCLQFTGVLGGIRGGYLI